MRPLRLLAPLLICSACTTLPSLVNTAPQITLKSPERLTFSQQGVFNPTFTVGGYVIDHVKTADSTRESGAGTGLKGMDVRYQKPISFMLNDAGTQVHLNARCTSLRQGGEDAVEDLVMVLNNRQKPEAAPEWGYGDHCEGTLQTGDESQLFAFDRHVGNGKAASGDLATTEGKILLDITPFTADITGEDPMLEVIFKAQGNPVAQLDLATQDTPLLLESSLDLASKRQIVALATLMREWRNFQQQIEATEEKSGSGDELVKPTKPAPKR